MNADLTFNTIVFKKSFDSEGKSERRSTTRGINTPDVLVIQSQDYVDSKTKVPGKRYTARIDRYDIDGNLASIDTEAHLVISVPSTAPQASVDNVVATFKAAVADASLIAGVLNNEK